MTNSSKKVERVGRWYDGSVASAGAACFTHPLDLLKVHLQERTQVHKMLYPSERSELRYRVQGVEIRVGSLLSPPRGLHWERFKA